MSFDAIKEFVMQNCSTNIFQIIAACLFATVIFVMMVINIAKNSKKRTLPLKIAFFTMFVGGMILYCSCHYLVIRGPVNNIYLERNLEWAKNAPWLFRFLYIIISSVMDVGFMFSGRANSTIFYSLSISKNPLIVVIFLMLHFIAFYLTATALLVRFGNDILRWIRIITSKISDVDLIYGVTPDSLVFGRNIADRKGSMLVYVDSTAGEDFETSIYGLGGILYSTNDAVNAAPSFLRDIRIKPGQTKLRLYALSDEYDKNLLYARKMLESLRKIGIKPEQTSLVLLGTDEWKGMNFQSSDSQYGYGSVMSFDDAEMIARLLINKYPLCNAINFDDNGCAIEDMNVLIVGFGRVGHEILRKLIANGQFEGSKFHATVYDPKFTDRNGFFSSQYPNMFANYDIDFEPHEGRGNRIFKFIQENAATLKYIVVCLKNRETARYVAIQMVDRLETLGYHINVYTCDYKSIRCYSANNDECQTHWLYDSELLYSGELDKYAMELNHRYSRGKDINEDWKNCDYFSRMSSRASVDYLIPFIRKMKSQFNAEVFTSEQRENLARSEHLRWCAFHYTFGFYAMEKKEFIERIKARQEEILTYGKSKIKITKDQKAMKHVCLADWDELDKISEIENSLTHGNKNYKDSDRENVDTVMKLITSEKQPEKQNIEELNKGV